MVFLSALVLLVGVGLVGGGVAQTFEISEISILAGFAPPAGIGALLVLLAGLLGLLSVIKSVKTYKEDGLRKRSLIGFILIGLMAVMLSICFVIWGITPW
jgi:uncharacterized membrane protein